MELRLTRARRIYSDGLHNAFTGITRLGDSLLVCFRSGTSHVSWDGAIRVIASTAGAEWTTVAHHVMPNVDLRDPKVVTFENSAMLYCGGRGPDSPLRCFASRSPDGRTFGDLKPLQGIPEGHWLWSVRPHGEWLYGAAYHSEAAQCHVALYSSVDGLDWGKVADFPVPGNEVAFDFGEDGRLWALVREDRQGSVPTLCVAQPPYTAFNSVTRLPIRLQGPMLKRLGGTCVIVGRRWDEPGRRNLRSDLFLLEDGRDLEYIRALPSGGDTSYAGWLDDGLGRGLISYYSSHEHKMDVGWEDEAASPDRAHAEHSTPADIFLADVRYR
jgi:hypothetical protein